MPSTPYSFHYKNLLPNLCHGIKVITPALITGTKKAILGFGLINIPFFIGYHGSEGNKIMPGSEPIIIDLYKSLFVMGLVSNIGSELSPILCGPYQNYCAPLARTTGYTIQTIMSHQTAASGFIRGIIAESLGFNYHSIIISESLASASEPVFQYLHQEYKSEKLLDINISSFPKLANEPYSELLMGFEVAHYVHAAIALVYLPALSQAFPGMNEIMLYEPLLANLNSTQAYESAITILNYINSNLELGTDNQICGIDSFDPDSFNDLVAVN